jgi:hypothetical protein
MVSVEITKTNNSHFLTLKPIAIDIQEHKKLDIEEQPIPISHLDSLH